MGPRRPAPEPGISTDSELTPEDPDVYYCRAEIFHRTSVERSIADIDKYLALTEAQSSEGTAVAEGKIRRVKEMRAYLLAAASGERELVELWDPMGGPGAELAPGGILAEPRKFAVLVAGVAALVALTAAVVRRLRWRKT